MPRTDVGKRPAFHYSMADYGEIEVTSKQFNLKLFTLVNIMRGKSLLNIVAEWLEEGTIPPLVLRDHLAIKPKKLNRILAVVGPSRAGNNNGTSRHLLAVLRSGTGR